MSVFKLCWKIIWSNKGSFLLYLTIFIVMSWAFGSNGGGEADGFTQTRVSLAVHTRESTPLLDGLKEELRKTANLVDLLPGAEERGDALFFGRVSYVLDVPHGFSRAYMSGEDPRMTSYSRPDDRWGRYAKMAIAQYFRLIGLYRQNLPQMGEADLVNAVRKNLEQGAQVVVHPTVSKVPPMYTANNFFNFMSYSLFNLLILGICALMLVFNQKEIRLRNNCSPISLRKLNGQLFLAALVYSLACWGVMSLLCLLVQADALPTTNLFLFLLNGLVFTIWAASAAFAIGQLVNKQDAVVGMATVITLATSMLGGAFVPQAFLGSGLLKFSQYLPTYWFVLANGQVTEIASFKFSEMASFLNSLAMQLLFALAFISVALVIARKKRQMV